MITRKGLSCVLKGLGYIIKLLSFGLIIDEVALDLLPLLSHTHTYTYALILLLILMT